MLEIGLTYICSFTSMPRADKLYTFWPQHVSDIQPGCETVIGLIDFSQVINIVSLKLYY